MSNPVPSSLALAVINTSDPISSAPHRNNYSAIQAAVNALILLVSGGTSGQVLTAADATDVVYQLIRNANVDPAAAIAYSKLSLAGSIVNADINAAAAIALSKLAAGTNHSLLLSGASTVGSLPAGAATQLLQSGGAAADPAWASLGTIAAAAKATAGAPTPTSSAAMKMVGLSSGTTIITPRSSRLYMQIAGTVFTSGSDDGAALDLRYGTGNGPANGAAATGTVASNPGSPVQASPGTVSATAPFTVCGIVTGLTPGVAVWIDLSLACFQGTGPVAVVDLTIVAHDIP